MNGEGSMKEVLCGLYKEFRFLTVETVA